jgi:hypothetical protein
MKTIATLGAAALVLVLAACGSGAPSAKPVQKNDAPPAAGSIESPNSGMKKRMGSLDGSQGKNVDAPKAP